MRIGDLVLEPYPNLQRRTLKFAGRGASIPDAALALTHLRAWHEAVEAG